MIASGKEYQSTVPGPKDETNFKPSATFKVVSMQPTNAQTGMKVWLPESVPNGV
jgi:hypothetical protein